MRLPVNHALPLAALLMLQGCFAGYGEERPGHLPVATNGPASDYPMVLGEPYRLGETVYRPEDKLNYDAVGYAGLSQAGGQSISISHKTLPLPSYVEITALATGKTILARVERRGPMNNEQLIELSPGAAAQLGVMMDSAIAVRVRRMNPPEPERAALRSGLRAPDRMDTPRSLAAVLMRKLESGPQVASGTGDRMPDAVQSPSPAQVTATPETPEAASPQPPARPQPRTVAGGRLVVQAGAFSSAERAAQVAREVGGQVQKAGNLYRVRIGPFASQRAANAALANAHAAGYTEARIQTNR